MPLLVFSNTLSNPPLETLPPSNFPLRTPLSNSPLEFPPRSPSSKSPLDAPSCTLEGPPRTPLFRLPSSNSPLPTPLFQLPSSNSPLPTPLFQLPSSNPPLPTPLFQLPSSNSPLPTPLFQLPHPTFSGPLASELTTSSSGSKGTAQKEEEASSSDWPSRGKRCEYLPCGQGNQQVLLLSPDPPPPILSSPVNYSTITSIDSLSVLFSSCHKVLVHVPVPHRRILLFQFDFQFPPATDLGLRYSAGG
ncbi:hypothetical protein GGR56DRAFT_297561 [Xylariaceae sp. FL0804]|nr:hypothetical protein GGR56DRAFT_297561 [Xylariaceae sp. FL0804]